MKNLKIKLNNGALLPQYLKPGIDGWMYLFANMEKGNITFNKATDILTYSTGVTLPLDKFYTAIIVPCDDAVENGLMFCGPNSLDQNTSELKLTFKKIAKDCRPYGMGERIAKILILPFEPIGFNIDNDE